MSLVLGFYNTAWGGQPDFTLKLCTIVSVPGTIESNTGNPAARAYMGTSAVAERGMVVWIMRLNMRGTEGQEHLYIPRISGS